jgi:cobalt-zinc-cadmium efflux system membrane fusion protein
MTSSAVTRALLIVALLGAGTWAGCGKEERKEGAAAEAHEEGAGHDEGEEGEQHEEGVVELQPEARANAGIRVALVGTRNLAGELETTGQVGLDEDRVAHVGPRVAGRLASVSARLGDQVRAGQTLAVIDSTELAQAKADYLQARAQEDLARSTYEREERLAAEKISSQKEVLEARADLISAEAARRRAEETLRILGLDAAQIRGLRGTGGSLIPITAPLDGVIVEKEATIGEVVNPEQKLFTIGDLGRLWIWIDVFERDLQRVHLEDDVEVAVDAFGAERFHGKVSFFSAQVDPATRTVRARIDVDNPGQRLRPGMFARVRLSDPHGARPAAEAAVPVVPENALQREGDGFVVFVQEGEHLFRVRPVQVGKRASGMAEILAGLQGGETVAVDGVFFLASEAEKETLGGDHGH